MLLAGDDRENPHGTCFQDLEQYKAKGMPIHSFIYEKASHAWDKLGESQLGHFYNEEVTNDAFGKMIEFLKRTSNKVLVSTKAWREANLLVDAYCFA